MCDTSQGILAFGKLISYLTMEQLIIKRTDKQGIYEEIIPQIKAVTENETDMIANMANIAASLKEAFGFFWTGFYIVRDSELVLGPFQGPLACTRIKYGRGVCGTAWKELRTVVVADVEKFPGHIACSSLSRSEIVVPVFSGEDCIAVLDIDSKELNTFDKIDAHYLAEIVKLIIR